MSLRRVVSALSSGRNVDIAIAILTNYDHPLSEKELTILTQYFQEERPLENDIIIPERIQRLQRRPLEYISRRDALFCIVNAFRFPSLVGKVKKALVQKVLPQVMESFASRHADRLTDNTGEADILAFVDEKAVEEEKLGGISAEDWRIVLEVLMSKGNWTDKMFIFCVEEIIKIVIGVCDNDKENTGELLKVYILHALVKIIEKSCQFCVQRFHKDTRPLTSRHYCAKDKRASVFGTSSFTHLSAMCSKNHYMIDLLKSVPVSQNKTALIADLFLHSINQSEYKIRHSSLATIIRQSSGTLSSLLGDAPSAGLMAVDQPADTILFALFTLGQSTVTPLMINDILSLLQALPIEDIKAYWDAKFSDIINQMFNPFLNNPKLFTTARAPFVANSFARTLVPSHQSPIMIFDETYWSKFCSTTLTMLQSKCRSGEDRTNIMTIFATILDASILHKETLALPKPQQVFQVVNHYLESGAEELMALCWRSLAAVDGCDLVAGHAVLKNLGNPTREQVRRMCLVNAGGNFTVANDVWKQLQHDALTRDALRPDAFLSMYFVAPDEAIRQSFLDIVATEDVIVQLSGENEYRRAAEVAICAAKKHHICEPLAFMLCNSDSISRKLVSSFVTDELKDDKHVLANIWNVLVKKVFSLYQDKEIGGSPDHWVRKSEKPVCVSNAIEIIAPLYLDRLVSSPHFVQVLTEVLLCCGHDLIVGHDELYYRLIGSAPGLYRKTFQCDTRSFHCIFRDHMNFLDANAAEVAKHLSERLMGPQHVATAAGRALAILLTRFSARRFHEEAVRARAAADVTFTAIRAQLQISVEFFERGDELDQVITANDKGTTEEYLFMRTKEMGLIKECPKKGKLPKGMTEEELESQNIKDKKNLEKAREDLLAAIQKRKDYITPQVYKHLSPFLALRVIGFLAPSAVEGLFVIYPFIHSTVAKKTTPKVVRDFALDACIGLLYHTPLRHIAKHFVTISARLGDPTITTLTSIDVAEVSAIASHLRQEFTAMLPGDVFSVLQPFCKGAFKAGRNKGAKFIPVQTQYQLLSILSIITSKSDIPMKGEAVSLFLNILGVFPALFKVVLGGLNGLVPHIPASACTPMIRGCFLGSELQKECSIAALSKFSDFEIFRSALAVTFVMSFDSSIFVRDTAFKILQTNNFELNEDRDANEIVSLLQEFGSANSSACQRIGKSLVALIEKFPRKQTKLLPLVENVGGMSAVQTIHILAPHLHKNSICDALNYLCGVIHDDKTKVETLYVILSTGKALLVKLSVEDMRELAPALQARLKLPLPKTITTEHRELHDAIVVVWLTIVAVKLDNVTFLEQTLDQQTIVLQSSSSPMVHGFVQECIREISHHPKMQNCQKLYTLAEQCLLETLNATQYGRKRAFAAGLVGIVQGLGLRSLRRLNVLPVLCQAQTEKQAQRSGAMIIIETLAEGLGNAFDPYALTLIPQLLEGVAEKDNKISECASDASKAVMSNMSDAGLSQLIPKLVHGLESPQTKRKTPSLSFIGFVAFCSPSILAHTLPKIMTHITSCLFDANNAVSSAAFTALKRVAGVVSNKEVKDHVDIILNAMVDPSNETENALDALLYTRFTTSIDPASLALLISVVSRALVETSPIIKGKAAQIVAAMVHLVSDTRNLEPYCDELLERLQSCAVESQGDVRATSAKAIAALAAAIRGNFLDRAYEWCFVTLHNAQINSEMAGAAQVLVEEALHCGDQLLFNSIDEIEKGVHSTSPTVREGFLHIMIYAPATLPSAVFQNFLPLAFPWVLSGVADVNDRVRNTALIAGSNILGIYGAKHLRIVLLPLLEGVVSEDTNQRQSSLLLLSKLVIHLVTSAKKKIRAAVAAATADFNKEQSSPVADKTSSSAKANVVVIGEEVDEEIDNELMQAGEVRLETARDAERRGISIFSELERQLGLDSLHRVLSALHIGRSESNSNVRTEVTNAWQVAVPNARNAVTKLLPIITQILVKFASSNEVEAVNVAVNTVDYTCARSNDFDMIVQLLADQYKAGTRRHIIGALICLKAVLKHADSERAVAAGSHIIACVLPSLSSEDEEIRTCAGNLFERLSKLAGRNFLATVLEAQINTSVLGVVEVVKAQPVTSLDIVFKSLDNKGEDSPYTPHDMELMIAIIGAVEDDKFTIKYIKMASAIIIRAIMQSCEGSMEAMEYLASSLPLEYSATPIEYIQSAATKRQYKPWRAAVLAAGAYARGISLEDPLYINEMYSLLVSALGGPETVAVAAAQQIINLGATIDKRVIEETLSEQEQQDLTACRRAACNYSMNFLDTFQDRLHITMITSMENDTLEVKILGAPKLFDTIQNYYLRILDHGLPAQRTQSVEALTDLLQYLPKATASVAVGTIGGKCTKALFTKQDGTVVAAILRLCQTLLTIPADGKERMLENTMAIAMINALLCDNPVARTLVHSIMVTVIGRNPLQTAMVLGSVVTKRNQIDSSMLQASVCRFVSVVMRAGKLTKAVEHCNTLFKLIIPWWEQPTTASVGGSAGAVIGVLAMNGAITDATVKDICEKAIDMTNIRGNLTVGGLACIYSLLMNANNRVDDQFRMDAVDAVKNAISFCQNDRLCKVWILRCVTVLCGLIEGPSAKVISLTDINFTIQSIISGNDGYLLSSLYDLEEHLPDWSGDGLYANTVPPQEYSMGIVEHFDVDIDDEVESAMIM